MNSTALRTSNPALSPAIFQRASMDAAAGHSMTVQGTSVKSLILLIILTVASGFTWSRVLTPVSEAVGSGQHFQVDRSAMLYMVGGGIAAFIVSLIASFAPRTSPITAPLYAGLEGLFLGGVSAFFESVYPGIVIQAVGITFGTLATMLFFFATGLVKMTDKFRMGIFMATGAVGLVYLASWILGIFGVHIPYIHESGLIGIGFSAFVVVVASLNLLLDFDMISRFAWQGEPKYMEWYGGFALLVTLVWLYIEVLHLLAKLNERRD